MIPCRLVGRFLAVLLIFNGSLPLTAKTFSFDEEKCHVEVPDGWLEQNVEGNKVSVVNADRTKSFTMRIAQTGENITLDDAAFIKGFESSMIANGVTIADRQHVPLAGIDAYAVDSTQPVPSGTVYNRMMVTLANGYAYGLNTSKLNAKPSEDDELNAIIKSFAFIGEPQIHEKKDPMDKIGYYIGMFVGVLAVISIFKWILRPKQRRL
jgi:hypothetical protein